MSDTTAQAETTTERKPPTLADIVREKTDDGKRIIDFFLDVMEDRIDGAELCHRIDAAKQLEKHKSKAAAKFLAKYKGVPCGHSIDGRPNPADPCTAEERSLVAVTLNAPPTLTQEFLTVLSGIDEFLMARLIRAQTAHGDTIIEFLDDVMQDRTDGFKTHHRIAAAKELIVHILRDEQPAPTPSPSTGEGWGEGDTPVVPAHTTVVPAEAGTQGGSGARSAAANPAHPEPNSPVVPAQSLPRTRYGAGTQRGGGARSTAANPAHPEPSSTVIPAKAGIQRGGGGRGRSTAANPAHPEPAQGPQDKVRRPRTRRTRTQRRRDGNARAATLRKGSERNNEKLEQHWHEPDPYGAPIDSATPGRSPPR